MGYNILILDPAIWRVWLAGYSNGTKYTAEGWAKKQPDADLIFNLTTFGTRTGIPDTETIINGVRLVWGKEKVSDFVEINQGDKVRGYSNAIKNGVINITDKFGGSSYRCGIGLTNKGHIIIAQSSTRVTELTFAQAVNSFVVARKQSVKIFVLEDGGGSVQEYAKRSKRYWTSTAEKRPVPTVICAALRGVPSLSRPIYDGAADGPDAEIIQALLGAMPVDGDPGPTTGKGIQMAQAALGFPPRLRCGILSAYTAKAMGIKSTI